MSGRKVQQLSEQTALSRVANPILTGVALGVAVAVCVLLLMSLVLSTRSVPQPLVGPMAIFAICFGALVSGFCCGRIKRQNGLAYGAACGAVFSAVALLSSLAIGDNGFGTLALIKIVIMLISAMLGGVMGVNARQRRKKL